MGLTARQLNRATLARQLLLQRERGEVVDAVRRIVAVQAQEPASPYIALWNRLAGFDPVDLDKAFGDHALIKATLMRITLHAVDAADYPVFHRAMTVNLRASRLNDRRFRSTGLTVEDADELVPYLLERVSRPHSNAEVEALLTERLGEEPERGVWWALRTFAPLVHAPTGAAWTFGPRPAYIAAPTAGIEPAAEDGEAALARLARRYLEGFGPASAEDFGQFALQQRPVARRAMGALLEAGEVVTVEGPEGVVLYDVPGAPAPAADVPAPPRLMAMWDSALLAYVDRSRIIPAEYRTLVTRRNGDVLPTLLVDGYVCGVWRPVEEGIEATAFHPLPEAAWAGLADEAEGLAALLAEREPIAYRRYWHWWKTLPAAEVRILAGPSGPGSGSG